MKKILALLLAAAMVLSLAACGGSNNETTAAPTTNAPTTAAPTTAGPTAEPTKDSSFDMNSVTGNYSIASFAVGGSWYTMATVCGDAFTSACPNVTVEVLSVAGGEGNPLLLQSGEADFGLTFGPVANWAYNGIIIYESANPKVASVAGKICLPHHLDIIINKDSQSKLGVSTFDELIEKKIPFNLVTAVVGSTGELCANLILEYYGLKYEDLEGWGCNIIHTDSSTAFEQLKDGISDVGIFTNGYAQTDCNEASLYGTFRWMQLSDGLMTFLKTNYGFSDVTVKSTEFTGIDNDFPAVGLTTNISCNADLPEDVVYAFTKALCENGHLGDSYVNMASFDAAEACLLSNNGNIPLHPGAERYYKDAGLLP
nr:TAXI family TRAP transporter solute-binding subunit [Lachnospiraceae bacterium]